MTRLEKVKMKIRDEKLKENIGKGINTTEKRWADYNSISIKRYSDIPALEDETLTITITYQSASAVVFSVEQSEYTFHMKKPKAPRYIKFWSMVEVGDTFDICYKVKKTKSKRVVSFICLV